MTYQYFSLSNKASQFDSKFLNNLNNLNSPCNISLAGNPMKHFEETIPEHITIEFETEHTGLRFL